MSLFADFLAGLEPFFYPNQDNLSVFSKKT